MPDTLTAASPPAALRNPTLALHGEVNDDMLAAWLKAIQAEGQGPFVLELTTTGGDADIGRRIADDVRQFKARTGRPAWFVGKTAVYSAGATIMGGFARTDRWLTRETSVMLHGRKLTKCVELDGPLASERPKVQALLEEIDFSLGVQTQDFERLIAGSAVTMAELEREIVGDWYLTAEEALGRGLVGGVL